MFGFLSGVVMVPFIFRVLRDEPDLGLREGDLLYLEPGARRPAVIQRDVVENYGRYLLMLEDGDLAPVSPLRPSVELAAVAGMPAARPLPPRDPSATSFPPPRLLK